MTMGSCQNRQFNAKDIFKFKLRTIDKWVFALSSYTQLPKTSSLSLNICKVDIKKNRNQIICKMFSTLNFN